MTTRRIIICDDDIAVATILAEHLNRCGHETLAVHSAQEVLGILGRNPRVPVDVVIADLCMPDVDGNQLLGALHAMHPGIHGILITAQPSSQIARLEVGRWDILFKPVQLEVLETLIARIPENSL